MSQILSPWEILTSSDKYPEREKSSECTTQVRINAADLAERVSKLLGALGITKVKVSSGYRTAQANIQAGGKERSAHMSGQAVDIEDISGDLGRLVMSRPDLLQLYDLYIESPHATPSWIHFQSRRTASGNRIFKP